MNLMKEIYILRSFSKAFLSGLRIATVVLLETMIHSVVSYKFDTDFNTSALSEGIRNLFKKRYV